MNVKASYHFDRGILPASSESYSLTIDIIPTHLLTAKQPVTRGASTLLLTDYSGRFPDKSQSFTCGFLSCNAFIS